MDTKHDSKNTIGFEYTPRINKIISHWFIGLGVIKTAVNAYQINKARIIRQPPVVHTGLGVFYFLGGSTGAFSSFFNFRETHLKPKDTNTDPLIKTVGFASDLLCMFTPTYFFQENLLDGMGYPKMNTRLQAGLFVFGTLCGTQHIMNQWKKIF